MNVQNVSSQFAHFGASNRLRHLVVHSLKSAGRSIAVFVAPAVLLICMLIAQPAIAQSDREAAMGGPDDYGEEMYDGMMDEGEMYDGMMEEDMYGEMDGGYGDSGPRGRSRSGGNSLNPFAGMFTSLDLAPLLSKEAGADVQSGPVLEAEARELFSAGHQSLACQLMYGFMVAEYKEAFPAIKNIKFSPQLKRPVWNIRWGISMAVRGADEVSDPSPIKEGGSPRGGMGNDMMGMDEMEMGRGGSRDEFEMGGMDEEYGMEMDMMDMGSEDMFGGMGPGGMEGRGPGGRGMAQAAAPRGTVSPPMLDASAEADLSKNLGLVAKVVAEEFDKRFQSGDFGSILTDVSAPSAAAETPGQGFGHRSMAGGKSGPADYMSSDAGDMLANAPESLPMWRPGLVYLGEGSSAEMTSLAKESKLDFLLHFDVVLKEGRQGFVQNLCRLRLIPVATGKTLIVSKSMDSSEVAQLSATGRLSDNRSYVNERLVNLWRIVDRDIKAVNLPTLSPDVARRQIGRLLGSGKGRSLEVLAEVRLYQAMELIGQEEAETAFDIVGGPDALMLLHGPRQGRLAMARKWAVASLGGELE